MASSGGSPDWIIPDWPVPASVRALSTTRRGGYSQPPYDGLNLGTHVGDEAGAVARNRKLLIQQCALPSEPLWLEQVHGIEVVDAATAPPLTRADGAYSRRAGVVCAVMTADCLPILLCDRHGRQVAAIHAGWRGLASGVIEAAVSKMEAPASRLMAWLGPAIGPLAFEVGSEVREQFLAHDRRAETAFKQSSRGRWLADIYRLARQRLEALGLYQLYGGRWCTYSDARRFYSYRRDGVTGRMATLIWLQQESS